MLFIISFILIVLFLFLCTLPQTIQFLLSLEIWDFECIPNLQLPYYLCVRIYEKRKLI